jgi:hypothetical protein
MPDYRAETRVSSDRSLILRGLPFQAGDKVEVIVRGHQYPEGNGERYPLRGRPIRCTDPFGSVAEEGWLKPEEDEAWRDL